MKQHFDILIVGGGLIGQTAALACAKIKGLKIALVDKGDILNASKSQQDGRATALSAASLTLFENLGVMLQPQTQPMTDMLITDGGLGEEPAWRLSFNSESADFTPPHMIENAGLMKALTEALKAADNITIFAPMSIQNLVHETSGVSGHVGKDTITADLLIAADGSRSPIRMRASINSDGRSYEQHALVTTIHHSLPHDGLGLQRFLPGGPLAILPLRNQKSQIVWSDKPSAIQAALSLSEKDFIDELSMRVGDHLGALSLAAPRQSYPLKLQLAQNYVATRLALIGDAAHTIHPLAGQGLNLGLRDVATLHDVLCEACATGRDIGGAALGEYEAWRKADVALLGGVTDGLSYLYGSHRGALSRPITKVIGHMRRIGLSAVNDTAWVKNLVMAEASGQTGQTPSLLTIFDSSTR